MNAVEHACEILGGLPALVTALDCSYQQAYQWKRGERPVPAHFCPAIETATRGGVTRRQLRPEDWQQIWPELAEAA